MKKIQRALCALMLLTLLAAMPAGAETSAVTTAIRTLDWTDKVEKVDWFEGGSEVLAKDAYGYLYDIDTGIIMRVKREWGHNHADVEPATAEDTEKLLAIAGGTFSWDSHAVILIAGGRYVAAAINTMPHGAQTITDNNYNGQFCLHTTNSITHGSHRVNQEHMKSIDRAYGWCQWMAMVQRLKALGQSMALL